MEQINLSDYAQYFTEYTELRIQENRENLIVYKVKGGFADGGLFCFEVEPQSTGFCLMTIYLAFDYVRGKTFFGRVFQRLFKALFPEFIHDVLWNHALCELKQVAELRDSVSWEMHI